MVIGVIMREIFSVIFTIYFSVTKWDFSNKGFYLEFRKKFPNFFTVKFLPTIEAFSSQSKVIKNTFKIEKRKKIGLGTDPRCLLFFYITLGIFMLKFLF